MIGARKGGAHKGAGWDCPKNCFLNQNAHTLLSLLMIEGLTMGGLYNEFVKLCNTNELKD